MSYVDDSCLLIYLENFLKICFHELKMFFFKKKNPLVSEV